MNDDGCDDANENNNKCDDSYFVVPIDDTNRCDNDSDQQFLMRRMN